MTSLSSDSRSRSPVSDKWGSLTGFLQIQANHCHRLGYHGIYACFSLVSVGICWGYHLLNSTSHAGVYRQIWSVLSFEGFPSARNVEEILRQYRNESSIWTFIWILISWHMMPFIGSLGDTLIRAKQNCYLNIQSIFFSPLVSALILQPSNDVLCS